MNVSLMTVVQSAAQFIRTRAGIMHALNAAVIVFLAGFFLFAPGILVAVRISDENLAGPKIPRHAWRLHRKLTPRYEQWARRRVSSGSGKQVDTEDVAGTEWPLFGSVFYLWATEAFQEAWLKDPALSSVAPLDYARGAIDASAALVMDPAHHNWVRSKWGADYMERENLFFRSLVIAAALSHDRLTGSGRYREILQRQALALAEEIDASPYGLLEDYPGECYPLDVMAAAAIIQQAYRHLGLDPEAWVARSRRAFEGEMLDSLGLIPFMSDARTGEVLAPSRGVVHAWGGVFAHELYPDSADKWDRIFMQHFWQEGFFAGFREFLPDAMGTNNWLLDIDAGPIIAGYSPAANAFGYAAARVAGNLDRAKILGEQITLATWPLPNGTLLGGRILSISPHAPYLGEATLLFLLTRTPSGEIVSHNAARRPPAVWLGILLYFAAGLILTSAALMRLRRFARGESNLSVPCLPFQFGLWAGLMLLALIALLLGQLRNAVLLILLAQFLPRGGRRPIAESSSEVN